MNSFKVGDKVWAQATVKHIDGKSLRLTFEDDWTLWFLASDCRPVEPGIKESLITESNCPEIPDSSSDPVKVGDAVRFVWPGHKHHRAKGVVKSVAEEDGEYLFESDCGRFSKWCHGDQIEQLNQVDPVNPAHYKQGDIECIEAIKAALVDGFPDFLRGNVIKYLWRYKEKGGVDDLRKALWYLNQLIKEVGE